MAKKGLSKRSFCFVFNENGDIFSKNEKKSKKME